MTSQHQVATDSTFGGPREEGISLDQVLASYLKTANLAKYDTTEPQRMLLGKPAVSEQPAKGQQGSKVVSLVKMHNQLVTTK